MSLASLPPEILLRIVSLLELNDIARIRQTCQHLRAIAQDKPIWETLLENQRLHHPIQPWPDLSNNSPQSRRISQVDLERVIVTTHRVARAWPRARPPPFRLRQKMGDMLFMLEMFLDRWLLIIYAEGLMYLWDTASDPMAPLGPSGTTLRIKACANLLDESENRQARWTSCAAQLSEDGQKLIVLLNMRPSPAASCRVYEVPLKSTSVSFTLLATVPLSQPEIIRAISFADDILILSYGSSINLVHVSEQPQRDLMVLSPYSDDLEEMWNAAIDVRIFNRFIFAFKARSIEVHNMDSLLNTTRREFIAIPLSKHFFQNITFREVKCSTPTVIVGEHVDIKFEALAYDVLQGLFNYHIRLQTRPKDSPEFVVALRGIYPLADHIMPQYTHLQFDTDLLTPTPTPTNDIRHPFRSTNISSRGFISAYALGCQGMRAVWVERVRGNTMREIQIWSRPGAISDEVADEEYPQEIDRISVYSITSPDLREDITRCTLSESTGLIVLGNRAGQLLLMDVDV